MSVLNEEESTSMSVERGEPERYPPSHSGFPPGGGNPPPGDLVSIPTRWAIILALSVAAGAITAALYLNGPARIVTAVSAAVVVCAAAIRVLSRIIR
jgi:hypothetical protein